MKSDTWCVLCDVCRAKTVQIINCKLTKFSNKVILTSLLLDLHRPGGWGGSVGGQPHVEINCPQLGDRNVNWNNKLHHYRLRKIENQVSTKVSRHMKIIFRSLQDWEKGCPNKRVFFYPNPGLVTKVHLHLSTKTVTSFRLLIRIKSNQILPHGMAFQELNDQEIIK